MIKINLLDYNEELRRIQMQKHTVVSLGIAGIGLLIIIALWTARQLDIEHVKEEIAVLEATSKQFEGPAKTVLDMKNKIKRYSEIIAEIELLRNYQNQPAKIMHDLAGNVPENAWLRRIRLIDKRELKKIGVPLVFDDTSDELVEIKGSSLNETDIIAYYGELLKIPYLQSVVLYEIYHKMTQGGGAGFRNFTIYSQLIPSAKPKPDKDKEKKEKEEKKDKK